MYTLTYESVATDKINSAAMEELLEKARANNQRDAITGCLIYYKGRFVQLLEGNKVRIEELYRKIKMDPRHKNVTLFSDDEISKRTFPNWGMVYYPIDENNTNKYEYEQFKRNLILMADLIEPTNVTSKHFWKKIKSMVVEPPM